jgi:hypothetical protein
MSTPRRMFEDPRNTIIVENSDPNARDKRFSGRPGVHREQRCCDDCAPHWETHVVRDGDQPGDDNPDAVETFSAILVEDATGESDNSIENPGYVWVQGPQSGYRPDFVSAEEWFRWQGVYYMPSPAPNPNNLPNPPRLVRVPGDWKVQSTDKGEFVFQFCPRCETWLESAWSDVLDAIPVVARGIAMIASYIPVYGTALSMVINATVSLAEGEPVGKALVDSVGQSLPGQPASGAVYGVAVGIARGESVDHAGLDGAVDGLGLGPEISAVLKTADQILWSVATGANITEATYNSIRDQLPPEAQQGMDVARQLASGESAQSIFLSQAEQMVLQKVQTDAASLIDRAKNQGAEALAFAQEQANSLYNQYAAEFGYQMAIDRLDPDHQTWIQMGISGGSTLRNSEQLIGTFGSVAESNPAQNGDLYERGKALIESGIKYNQILVSQILNYPTFSILVDELDALNNVWVTRAKTYTLTDAWRRGFTIAIAACDGCSERGPGQTAIYQTMAELGGRDGFDAGQAVQFARTHWKAAGFDDLVTANVLKTHPLPPELAGGLQTDSPAPKVDPNVVVTPLPGHHGLPLDVLNKIKHFP